uniref:Uncharacterized protein n=1 Tax=Anguilla anguilla TaxID=7936 RepID=A0A0E9R3B3_ANGAN
MEKLDLHMDRSLAGSLVLYRKPNPHVG